MSEKHKDWLAKWLPLLLAILSGWGMFFTFKTSTEMEIRSLKEADALLKAEIMPMDKRMAMFIPRVEFAPVIDSIHRDIADLKVVSSDTNRKVDALYRRQSEIWSEKKTD